MTKTEYNELGKWERDDLQMSDHDVPHNQKVIWFCEDIKEFVKQNNQGFGWASLVMDIFSGPSTMIWERNGFWLDTDLHKADGSYDRSSSDWKFARWAIKKALKNI